MCRVFSMWRHVHRKLRQTACPHRISVREIKQVAPDRVEVPCKRCDKVLSARYGLAIHAQKWEP